ncbi:OmpA family protein [Mangrovimonas sp. ST2L15]|uniref:OmpA family protein n=1 Tax=Mangrovimonas sp. ST2L15 TaxID=1645916 RepID=UPI0006B48319|nr:OmpA family protein [Mangrovimonas sp. ST2L15]
MKKLNIFILIAMIGCLVGYSQNAATETADRYYQNFEFVRAIKSYEKLVEKGKGDEYVYRQLAEANYNILNTEEAEKWYYKVLESTPGDAEIVYKYSQMLKANGKYDRSNEYMRKFAELKPNDQRAVAFMENPDYIPQLLEKEKTFRLKNLDINSEQSDFGGTIKDGKFYFATARNKSRKTYGWNEQPFLDIYVSEVTADGFMEADQIDGDVNTQFHEGVAAISPNGTTMYFSRESFSEGMYEKDSTTRRKISVNNLFEATFDGEKWGYVKPFPLNSNTFTIKDPSVSKDGKTLYFSSDMPGGHGGYDIYKVSINGDGTYGDAVNLGDIVNTEGDEGFPFISSTDVLYFSSNGHLGLGNLDVFFTKLDGGSYLPVRNAGVPVNGNMDDFAFTIDEESGEGFVSSNREGGKGSDDIYQVFRLQPMCTVDLIAMVTDSQSGEPLQGASVSVYDDQGSMLLTQLTDAEGKATFLVECDKQSGLEVSLDGYESVKVSVDGTFDESTTAEVALDPIEMIVAEDQVVLNPIYFEFDKSNITPEAAFELDKLVQVMNKYPDMVINATSHTDSRGSASYNERLSDRRAKTTVQYVISKGIDASRITGKGMGESDPKVDCGSNCSEEEHQLNRRSEFIITTGGPQDQ